MDTDFKDLVIVKRSGQRVSFNGIKIAVAIKNAFDNVYDNPSHEKINYIYSEVLKYISINYKDRKTINVEDIQDIIENTLKNKGYLDVYNAFSDYRNRRKMSRDYFDKKSEHKFVKAAEKIILNTEEDSSVGEMLFKYGKTISEEYSKAYLIDNKYLRSHNDGEIYIHNLDNYLLGTFGNTFVDLSKINSYDTYFEDITSLLLNIKYEASEICIASFDHVLSKYVLYMYKKIFSKNIKFILDMNGLSDYINMNSLELVINKSDNINLNIELYDKFIYNDVIKNIFINTYNYSYEELKNIIYNKIKTLLNTLNDNKKYIKSKTYSISIGSNTSYIGSFINDIYLSIIDELDRLDVVTIFKISDSTYLDNIIKLIYNKKNIVINNLNASYNKKYYKDSYLTEVEYFSSGKKITDNIYEKDVTSIGRSIIRSTAIDLVRVAFKSKNETEFFNNLDIIMDLVKNELKDSYEYISNKNVSNYEYLFKDNILLDCEKLDDNHKIRKVTKLGTLEISYAGLCEAVKLIKNNLDIDFALKIINYMKDKCEMYTNELKLNYSLSEETDNNVLNYFTSLDSSIYGNVLDVTDKKYEYFSTYLDNNKYKTEVRLHDLSNGGYNEILNMKGKNKKQIVEEITKVIESNIGFIKVEL